MQINISPSSGSEEKTLHMITWVFSGIGFILLLAGLFTNVLVLAAFGGIFFMIGFIPWLLKKEKK